MKSSPSQTKSAASAVELPLELHSPEQIEAVLFELDAYIGQRRRTNTKQSGASPAASPVNWTSELTAVLGAEATAAAMTLAALEARQIEITTWRDLPLVQIILPTRPPTGLRRDLVSWFRSQISPALLVKFTVNPATVGGLAIRTSRRIHDFTFRRQLLNHRASLPQLLRKLQGK